ncbi:MAG: FAD-binding oxidoreductase, partial [Polymorphobacter sp.]
MNMAAENLAAITAAVGAAALVTDAAECDFYAQDVFSKGPPPLAVFRPTSVDMLAAGIAAATGAGVAVIPRGGGMSYTGGYVAPAAGALLIDTGGLDRIIDINQADMTVTVEAGCTWAKLYATLKPLGLRAFAWGTLSGLHATVGGGMSQNGLFWGAGNGAVTDGAICFDVVLADGRILRTGSSFF